MARDYDAVVRALADAPSELPPLELLDLTQFAVQPKARWLVRGILPPDSLVVVFGPPKGGKTFSTTDMLMHAAHGLEWHGHPIPRALRVAFLAGEGRNGLRVRLHAWAGKPDCAGYVLLVRADITAKATKEGVSRKSVSSAWSPLQDRGHMKLVEPGSVMVRVQRTNGGTSTF
jgi:hypothetical protein